MGAWGIGLFSDDLACDVRDEFTALIGEGLSAGEATAALVENYRTAIGDPDEGPVFWLALALTQWKIGRLQDEVRDRALSIIRAELISLGGGSKGS